MESAFGHEDEGTAEARASNVKDAMEKVGLVYVGAIPDHRLAKACKKVLSPFGFTEDNTLVTTCLCCDEVCRDLEDEFRAMYGSNFNICGIAGFPFGGATAFGSMCRHIPQQGHVLVLYGREYDMK